MGEQDRGFHADRISISYWDELGNETVRYFAANLPEEEIPDIIDSPSTGLPAGRDKDNPPQVAKLEPYKTHLAVREGAPHRGRGRGPARRGHHAAARAPRHRLTGPRLPKGYSSSPVQN